MRKPSAASAVCLLALSVLTLSASTAAAQTPAKVTPHLGTTFDQNASGPVLITATVTPAEATGTVQFRLNSSDLGSPVPLVNGTAQSPPVVIPKQQSYEISAYYSGDEVFAALTTTLHSDSAPDDDSTPAPAVPVAPAQPTPAAALQTPPARVRFAPHGQAAKPQQRLTPGPAPTGAEYSTLSSNQASYR